MPYYAQIDESNIVVAVSELSGTLDYPRLIPLAFYDQSVIGMEWSGAAFAPVVIPPAPDTWLISVGAFFDRFGAFKIPILASTDAGIQAMIKDAQVRTRINLQRADLTDMLDYIIAQGFAVNKTIILGTPAAPDELP
jgi:hypothetical protein